MPSELAVGIHDLSFRTTSFVLHHSELARHNGTDVAKYHKGLGQRSMSVPAADEDIVTMAAAAALPLVRRHGPDRIRTVVLATESSVDQSKAAGIYVHSLLGLPPHIRVVEVKQACYGATAALQFAAGLVHQDPTQHVLVIASDVSRYDLDSPGEATQGAAAAAMLVSADPALLELSGPSGLYTADVMDFWRPNYRATALVDGKKSVTAYLDAVENTWRDYRQRGGLPLEEFRSVCYHQPYTRLAFKAHRALLEACGARADEETLHHALAPTTGYNEVVGNSYTASLYLALTAALENCRDLEGRTVGLFSYGSGSVAEFIAAQVRPGYRSHLRADEHQEAVNTRQAVDCETYRALHRHALPTDGRSYELPHQTRGPFRLAALRDHQRIYEAA
ncbi:hydroxymethylglutaryl-CoA synthase [Streptomyces capillispiralis]|uniref:Hydroxymethylglutaryl-CoA synthase n=1 Tax=Streptomyces capillispiralis TaxID=68182 RepID=A0A561SGI8_9ACTN|nr:hydroxymethylglutaryl-CoA synthase [Streptomyces capillispiralis]TWF73981.1 hydroxymethylglutaryl-CoA synthase [Streptomyces capillispiralis]GHH96330.1 hydroxymethylglutaryl-CoA synthase [Streptomyces capillispiralis]